eukprot:6210006-Pleurochrysis_carterae.AAC.1
MSALHPQSRLKRRIRQNALGHRTAQRRSHRARNVDARELAVDHEPPSDLHAETHAVCVRMKHVSCARCILESATERETGRGGRQEGGRRKNGGRQGARVSGREQVEDGGNEARK